MYEAELIAVATGAAGTLVAAIATSGAEKMRLKVAHFFRRATSDQQQAASQAVDETAAQLTSLAPEARSQVVTAWTQLIAQYLSEHRDAISEVDELASPISSTQKVWNQHNTGTGTFIGGDVNGGVTFNYGSTQDDGH